MATVKEINHDSSTTLSDFYSTIVDPDGALTVTPGAALNGSTNGLSIDYDAGLGIFNLTEPFAAISGNELRVRAYLDANTATPNGADSLISVDLRNSIGGTPFFVQVVSDVGSSTGFYIFAAYAKDTGGNSIVGSFFNEFPLTPTCFELRAIKETADGNADGIAQFWVNNTLLGTVTNIENFNIWSASGGMQELFLEFNTSLGGIAYFDEFNLNDNSSANLGCSELLTIAPMTKPASIDASGTFIYVALLNSGFPILTKISTDLDADGTTVFDPGAGDNIGVECGRFDANVIWIAGAFGDTDVVEKSEDAGASFVVKDDGGDGFDGDVFAFSVGPDSDDRVIVDDNDANIQETIDSGANWIVRNADGFNGINAFGRLGKNVQETVVGQLADVTDTIEYSVNSGADLEDFQTGVFPSADVTGVIVN